MSNPWCTTPGDVALQPFYKLLKEFLDNQQKLEQDIKAEITKNDNSEEKDEEQNGTDVETKGEMKSPLIQQLRKADKINRIMRHKEIHSLVQNEQVVAYSQQLTKMFDTMSNDLEQLSGADALTNSFIQAYRANQIVWDDISQENKAKMVNSIRSAIEQILTLYQNKLDQASYRKSHQTLTEMATRTEILDRKKSTDDYEMVDLFDLLVECTNSLEIMRVTFTVK